ncbi:uncharacterized protein [Oscarella lobularis]|uniref:uncharacterized protein n=1 Tax=Oscarella lobularis TaxID=121494 RepID=UPI0033135299
MLVKHGHSNFHFCLLVSPSPPLPLHSCPLFLILFILFPPLPFPRALPSLSLFFSFSPSLPFSFVPLASSFPFVFLLVAPFATAVNRIEAVRKRKMDDALIKMIALDLQPASVVEDTGFRHLVHTLDSRYQLPSRRSLMRSQLPDVYEKIKANLKERISKVQFCSITTDLWTSRTTESYITVTCHFVKERVLQSVILETWHVPEAHTGDNLAAELKRIAQLWEIDEKIVGVVTDSAANIVLAVAKNRWKHLSCFAHVLNLVVQHAIKADSVVSDILKNVELSSHFFIKALPFIRESAETAQQRLLAEMNLVPRSCSVDDDADSSVAPASELWKSFETRVMEKTTARTSFVDHTIELREYLHTKNLLLWWKSHIIQFPVLSKMAEKYLSMAGTSVPSERSFSAAGQLISERRSRLKPENGNMHLFLHKNLKVLDHQ